MMKLMDQTANSKDGKEYEYSCECGLGDTDFFKKFGDVVVLF